VKAFLPRVALTSLITLLASACYRNPDSTSLADNSPAVTSPLQGRLQKLDVDLKMGDVGPNVRTVHDYLATYGYYPNADLAAEFPAWRPLIANAPQDPNAFDQKTADAVRQLQVNYGLSPTGIVDARTRTAMLVARCGVPDGIPRLDSSDKFSYLSGNQWRTQTVPVFVSNLAVPPSLSVAQISSATSAATATWAGATNLQFTVTVSAIVDGGTSGTGGAGGVGGNNPSNIMIQFGALDGAGNKLAQTSVSVKQILITLDKAETWSTNTPTPSNAIDLQSVVLHELGHAIGLGHSGVMGFGSTLAAAMFPQLAAGAETRALAPDDRLAVRPLYDTYVQAPSTANDIGAGTDGSVWIIGTMPGPGGFRIHKWNGSGWDMDPGGTATRISVASDGTPWVVTSAATVWHKLSNSALTGDWQLVSGISASDIAASGGAIWAVSTTAVAGGFQVYSYNGQQWVIDTIGAVRIAADNFGIPWILQASGAVLIRYEGGWEPIPAGSGGGGIVDIAVPPGFIGAYAWGLKSAFGVQLQLSLFDQQNAYPGPPGLDAPDVTQWWSTSFVGTPGTSVGVAAAGPNGQPWIVDGTGRIFRSTIQ
jgi:peptidoglycan hydrolase-like protein with peptidoglycan-binding domain